MDKVLIYGGTTEARILAEELAKARIYCLVFVATEYGETILNLRNPYLRVHVGRLTDREMADFYDAEKPDAIVDATHPYAEVVKENIYRSIRVKREFQQIPFFRIYREEEPRPYVRAPRYFDSVEDCAEALKETDGKVFLTTGSKTLPVFAEDESLRRRLTVRVLPSLESLEICRDCGIPGNRIIAMQGPFSEEMNKEMLRSADADILVLKESGNPGGEASRIAAAQKLEVDCYIISRPAEKVEGNSLEDVFHQLLELFGVKSNRGKRIQDALNPDQFNSEARNRHGLRGLDETNADPDANGRNDNHNTNSNNRKNASDSDVSTRVPPRTIFWEISLIGIGMDSSRHLTKEAEEALKQANFLFGAPRMIDRVSGFDHSRMKFPYYTADRIISVLSDLGESEMASLKPSPTSIITLRAAILFSGDTGFYSGCEKLYAALRKLENVNVKIFPGISSVSAMAAACGVSWQDAAILSTHGISEDQWIPSFLDAIRHHEKTFCITSGSRDIRKMGGLLLKTQGVPDSCEVLIGGNLGSPEERLIRFSAEECTQLDEPGLYTVLVKNLNPTPHRVSPGSADGIFTRGETPMTKEEIRALSICKLRLDADSVVYDIGCGTGSVSCDIAALSPRIRVYGVDVKPEAALLTRQNAEKLGLANIQVQEGTAPECLKELPMPTHVFVGGSNGNLRNMIEYLKTLGTCVHVVVNAVSLETVSELTQLIKEKNAILDVELVQVSVSRSRRLGSHHLMMAENPVYIASFTIQ